MAYEIKSVRFEVLNTEVKMGSYSRSIAAFIREESEKERAKEFLARPLYVLIGDRK